MKQSSNLQSVIYRSYLTSSLVPLLMIELVLLVLYFGTNSYIASQNQATLLTEVSLHLQDITLREAAKINTQLIEVTRDAKMLQQNHQSFFRDFAAGECLVANHSDVYRIHPNGAYYKWLNTGGSSLYYAASSVDSDLQLKKAHCSESLDPFLQSVVSVNPVITQAYLNTRDNMTRIYPFIKDIPTQFGPDLNPTNYNFYYLADAVHNPQKDPVWTGVYLDPAGQGWMISNIVPIYRENVLEGVSGLDVTIDRFIQQILSLEMPWDATAFMVDREGQILAAPEKIASLLNLPALQPNTSNTQKAEILNQNQAYSLLAADQSPVHLELQLMFIHQTQTTEIHLDNQTYLVSQEFIPETGWRLFTLVDEALIFNKLHELKISSDRLGILAIIAMLLFYALFFWYLQRKSIRIAEQIATPIEQLSQSTSNLGKNSQTAPLIGVKEIDTLNKNFSAITRELDAKTRQLIELEVREKVKQREAELLETLALTDRLTRLANRHKLDEILESEFARAQRFENLMGIILMDIDHFKQINDTYGHQAGDRFLQEIAGILQQNTRKTDTVGRWGGEEFMIICPKITESGITEVAEHLRQSVAKHRFTKAGKRTASFGATLSKTADNIDAIIRRADKALYTAKNKGRNRVETN